ncbi:MAG: GNAT family N-acetyltransferase [Bacteroidota bacterium]
MNLNPVTLHGKHVRLESLSTEHIESICEIGLEKSLWKWTITNIETREDLEKYVKDAIYEQLHGTGLPFAIMSNINSPDGSYRIVGSSRYFNIEPSHKRLEIGHTWIAPQWQRTIVNTEAKYLLLKYAFEKMGVNRVEFKTDALNKKSRIAIKRIGAHEEGILRKHSITQLGRVRDTVYYSIISTEWDKVKKKLENKLAKTKSKG